MPRQSHSLQPLNEQAVEQSIAVEASGDRPAYYIRGLADADALPILYAGVRYDLKALTAEELTYLVQFPDQVPYLSLDRSAVR